MNNDFTTENTREQIAELLGQARTAVLNRDGDDTAARLLTKATTLMEGLQKGNGEQRTRFSLFPAREKIGTQSAHLLGNP